MHPVGAKRFDQVYPVVKYHRGAVGVAHRHYTTGHLGKSSVIDIFDAQLHPPASAVKNLLEAKVGVGDKLKYG